MRLRSLLSVLIGGVMVLAPTLPHAQKANDPLTRFLDNIFKKEQPPAAAPPPAAVRPTRPQQVRKPVRQVPKQPAPARVIVRDAGQTIEANTFIAIIGDAMAGSLIEGLAQAFASDSDVAVIDRTRTALGLTSAKPEDWSHLTRDITPGTQPITLGVVFMGLNDQRLIKDGEQEIPFNSPQWQALYRERIGTLIRMFAERGAPLVWVGLPPMKDPAKAEAANALNALYRDETLQSGGVYVDLRGAFSNDDGRFTESGPDIKGQIAQLRSADGIGFTRAGIRKAAHFVDLEIRRLLQARGLSTVIAAPSSDSIQGEGLLLPDVPGIIVIPVKPLAGPILPLATWRAAQDGQLAQAPAPLEGDAAALVHRTYAEGRMPEPVPGRVDDFSWPKRGEAIAGTHLPGSDLTATASTR